MDKPYDERSDIWSTGCVLYEVIMLKPPFQAANMNQLYERVTKGNYPPISPSYSSDLAHVIKTMLQVKPTNRPSCR